MALNVEKDTGGNHGQESESLPLPSTTPGGKCSEQRSGFLFWLLQFLNPLFYVRLVQYYSGIAPGAGYGKRITESPHDPTPVPADATVIDCGYNGTSDVSRFSQLPQVELEHMDLARASGDNKSVKSRRNSYSEDEKAASHISNEDNDIEPAEPEAVSDKPDKNASKPGRKSGKKGKRGKAKK